MRTGGLSRGGRQPCKPEWHPRALVSAVRLGGRQCRAHGASQGQLRLQLINHVSAVMADALGRLG